LYVWWHSCGIECIWTISSILFPLYFLLLPNQITCSSLIHITGNHKEALAHFTLQVTWYSVLC
jgi:hypothetical protein